MAIVWLAIADLPTVLRVGPLSLSGAATLVTGGAAVLLAPVLLLHGRGRSAPRSWSYAIAPGPRRGVVPLPLVLFCAFALVGLLWDPSQGGLQQVAVYCAFAASIGVGALYSEPGTANRFLHVVGIVMGVAGLLSIPLFLLNVPIWGNRSFALTGMLSIAVLVPTASKSRLVRIAPYALTIGIAVSLSRTALAIAVLLLAFAILRSRHGMRGLRIVLALVGLAVAGVVAFLAVPSLRDRFTQGDNGVDLGGIELNTSGRSNIWALVIEDAEKHPWFGQGAGTASDLVTAKYPFVAQPHNEYLRLWHDFGVFGLALVVVALLMLGAGALHRARRAPREQRAIHWAALIGLISVAAAALTDNPFIYPFVMLPLGVVLGLSIGRRELDVELPEEPRRLERRPAPPRVLVDRGAR